MWQWSIQPVSLNAESCSKYTTFIQMFPFGNSMLLLTSILGPTAYNVHNIIIAHVISGDALTYQPTNQQTCVDNAKQS